MKKLMITLALLLTGCGAKLLEKNSQGSDVNVINMDRQFQRVITYDCLHNVISDSIETVKSPTYFIEIAADHPSKVASSSFRNKTNNATPGLIVGYYQFTLDYSYGAFNMHVEPGINIIEYKFYDVYKKIVEEGTVTIDIHYSEKTLPGYQESTYCPQPTPTPSPTPNP